MGARNLSHWHIDDKAFAKDALAGAILFEIMIKTPGENLFGFPRTRALIEAPCRWAQW